MPRFLLPFLALIFSASPAFAHKLIVDSRVKGDRLQVEVFFEDDTPAQQAKVTVLNGDTVVAEGRADDKGVWSCAKPGPGSYLVKAESLGHAAKETVVIAGLAKSEHVNPQVAVQSEAEPTTDRDAKMRTPWLRVAVGLGSILVLTLLVMLLRRGRSLPAPD